MFLSLLRPSLWSLGSLCSLSAPVIPCHLGPFSSLSGPLTVGPFCNACRGANLDIEARSSRSSSALVSLGRRITTETWKHSTSHFISSRYCTAPASPVDAKVTRYSHLQCQCFLLFPSSHHTTIKHTIFPQLLVRIRLSLCSLLSLHSVSRYSTNPLTFVRCSYWYLYSTSILATSYHLTSRNHRNCSNTQLTTRTLDRLAKSQTPLPIVFMPGLLNLEPNGNAWRILSAV